MLNYKKDFKETELLLDENIKHDYYDRLCFSSNEHLEDIFSYFDFKNKDILSVIGSGDQAISFYLNDVNKVDLFDINRLAIYYYYIRIWALKYFRDIYPGTTEKTRDYIKELLKYVEVKNDNELNVYNYWQLFVEKYTNFDFNRLFYYCNFPLLKQKIDLNGLINTIKLNNSKIWNIDLSGNFKIDEQYDYIYTSNIVDYVPRNKVRIYRDNIYNLLKDGGIVICSNLTMNSVDKDLRLKNIFEERFQFGKIFKKTSDFITPGYYYIKK